jgi:hypothetical protein
MTEYDPTPSAKQNNDHYLFFYLLVLCLRYTFTDANRKRKRISAVAEFGGKGAAGAVTFQIPLTM